MLTRQRNTNRLASAIAATLIAASPAALAQSTSGSVFGQAAAGETVVIESSQTGFHREIAVAADGTYRMPALPPGDYRVTLRHADGTTVVREGIAVSAGTGTAVNFVAAAADETIGEVIVTGVRVVNPIDVSSVESVTILSAEMLEKIPVARDLTSAALLAPGTVRGDVAFADGNLASFGGASVAENAYYVNGFNITNSFRNLNFSKIPFEAIAEQQVKTGGYGAEFGRSLGGVVSQTTKRGTNTFQSGSSLYFTPGSLRAKTRNANHSNPLEPSSSGPCVPSTPRKRRPSGPATSGRAVRSSRTSCLPLRWSVTASTKRNGGATSHSATTPNDSTETPQWLLKLDWNINDSNTFELTAFSDEQETTSKVFLNTLGQADRLGLIGTQYEENGGQNYVGKWTSYITDNFTVSALYGHGEFSRGVHLQTASGLRVAYSGNLSEPASGCPVIVDGRPAARRAATGTFASTCNITATLPNAGAIDRQDAGDTRDQARIDAEWQLGAHVLRFGYDLDDYESLAGTSTEGGRTWSYSTTASGQDRVREQIFMQGSTVEVKQRAFYVEDNWNITDSFLFSAGLRWDSFENINGQGETYVDIKNQFGPRLGFSWDVQGDSSLKVYGNAGRYALPLTSSVAVRGASASLFTRQNFTFTGVDPVTGAPTGLTSLGPAIFLNAETGEPKDARTIASKNLDPMYQDEFILGAQMAITQHQNVGARAIYRELKAAIDDNCDYAPIAAAGEAAGLDPDDFLLPSSGFPYCRMFNPGEDAIFLTDFTGDGTLTETTIDADLLSPKARRTYKALELFWDGTWDRDVHPGVVHAGVQQGQHGRRRQVRHRSGRHEHHPGLRLQGAGGRLVRLSAERSPSRVEALRQLLVQRRAGGRYESARSVGAAEELPRRPVPVQRWHPSVRLCVLPLWNDASRRSRWSLGGGTARDSGSTPLDLVGRSEPRLHTALGRRTDREGGCLQLVQQAGDHRRAGRCRKCIHWYAIGRLSRAASVPGTALLPVLGPVRLLVVRLPSERTGDFLYGRRKAAVFLCEVSTLVRTPQRVALP